MTNIKKGDFVEVEYTGKIKEDNFVFDTTSEKTAKENQIHSPGAEYSPVIVCIGQHQLLKGLDEKIQGKEIGKEYTFELTPEEGFGKKTAQLLKLVPASAFKQQRPEVGMQVEIDGQMGIIKTASGGRVVVDFNHPLASRELVYTIKANRIVTDDGEKIKSVLNTVLHIRKEKIHVDVKEGKAKVKTIKLPEPFVKELEKRLKELVPTIKELVFEELKTEKQSLNTSR